MSEPRYIHIRNWDRYQHADTTRNKASGAPWIKDYTGQMHDEDFMNLSYADRGLLQSIRLQYALSRGRGMVDSTTSLHRLLGQRVLRTQLKRLSDAGFIEFSASKSLAGRLQPARPDVDVEREPLFISPEKKPKATPVAQIAEKRKRQPDPLWDAMVSAFDAGEFTESSRGVMNRAVGELRKIGATPKEVSERKRAYGIKFPDIPCTPTALVKHWPYLNGAKAAPTTAAERYRQERQQ